MEIIEIVERNDDIIYELCLLWERSVRATHHFLNEEDIESIKNYVPLALKDVPYLFIIKNNNSILGFMGIENQKLAMLFIDDQYRHQGLGKTLLLYGIKEFHINELTVNEQNIKAFQFYSYMGFKTYRRSELDEQGDHHPILYMKRTVNSY
ncbi:MAG: GNAT family N-acetyltransferase [Bacilli bacterium]|nr:GNAT family N-acetyltransferase [Bacilli bacterium]